MPLLIDGFNLIYQFPDLEELMRLGKLSEARQGLFHKLRAFQKITGQKKIYIVLDGKKEESIDIQRENAGRGLEIHYSLYFSADALIREFIKMDPNPKMTTVVTSDRALIDFASSFKMRLKRSEAFAQEVQEILKKRPDEPTSEKEIDPVVNSNEIAYWEKIFKK